MFELHMCTCCIYGNTRKRRHDWCVLQRYAMHQKLTSYIKDAYRERIFVRIFIVVLCNLKKLFKNERPLMMLQQVSQRQLGRQIYYNNLHGRSDETLKITSAKYQILLFVTLKLYVKMIVSFHSRIENSRRNINTMFHTTFIIKHVEIVVAIFILNHCNIRWSILFFKKNFQTSVCSISV